MAPSLRVDVAVSPRDLETREIDLRSGLCSLDKLHGSSDCLTVEKKDFVV